MFDPTVARLIEDFTEANVTYLQHGRKPELKPDPLDYPELTEEEIDIVAFNTGAMVAGIAQRQ